MSGSEKVKAWHEFFDNVMFEESAGFREIASSELRQDERKQFDEWRERFINETGFPPNEADAWQARAALAQQAEQELLALVEAKNDHIEVLEQRIRDIKLALNEAYEKGCHESGHQEAQQAVPEGWKLVPAEPTHEMIRAMEREWLTGSQMNMASRGYKQALAAAPAAPQAEQQAGQSPAEGDLEAAFAWIEEAVEYVNEETRSPSLEREGQALLHRLSAAIKESKAKPKGVEPAPELDALLQRFERNAQRFGELWERCQGKGWPAAESDEFTKIRDERLPALKQQIRAALQAPAPAPVELTKEQAEALHALDALVERGFKPPIGALIELLERAAASPAVGDEQPAPSPTAGMTLAQRILHVGGRNNAAGYVEFGSTQAVEALIRQVLRDLPRQAELTGTPPRGEYVKAARAYALAYGLRDDSPAYLPRTQAEADAFEPHAWVIGAMMQAFGDGWADGHAAGIEFMKEAAAIRHPGDGQ